MALSTSSFKAIVDIQGFNLPRMGFVLKEITILTQTNMKHWIFSPPKSFEDLNSSEKRQVQWLTKNHHKFHCNFGFKEYKNTKKLIRDALRDVDLTYVKGSQKPAWLKLFFK